MTESGLVVETVVADLKGILQGGDYLNPAGPLDEKWRAFGWTVRIVDGHDYAALTKALTEPSESGRPTFIIANTIKGKGVSFMENVAKWHHGVPNETELKQALAELEAAEANPVEVSE